MPGGSRHRHESLLQRRGRQPPASTRGIRGCPETLSGTPELQAEEKIVPIKESRKRASPRVASAADLITRLPKTFPVAAPPPNPLDAMNGPDARELDSVLRGRSWLRLTARDLWPYRAGLTLLSTSGYVYYLPAFIHAALSATEARRGDFVDHIMLALTPPKRRGAKSCLDRTDALNARQKKLVRDFIRLMHAEYGAPWPCVRPGNGWKA